MKLVRTMIAIAMMYSNPATTGTRPPVAPEYILPEFIGAPCSTQIDIEEGTCNQLRFCAVWLIDGFDTCL